jgi:uncharacterized protein YukE
MNEDNKARYSNLQSLVRISDGDRRSMGNRLLSEIRSIDGEWQSLWGKRSVAAHQVVSAPWHRTTQDDVDKIQERMDAIDRSIRTLLDQLQGPFSEGVGKDLKS